MTNNGTLNYNLTSEKPAYMLSEENYTKYINERNKLDPSYPDSNDIQFLTVPSVYTIENNSLYRDGNLVGRIYDNKTGMLVEVTEVTDNTITVKDTYEKAVGKKVPVTTLSKFIEKEITVIPVPTPLIATTDLVLRDRVLTYKVTINNNPITDLTPYIGYRCVSEESTTTSVITIIYDDTSNSPQFLIVASSGLYSITAIFIGELNNYGEYKVSGALVYGLEIPIDDVAILDDSLKTFVFLPDPTIEPVGRVQVFANPECTEYADGQSNTVYVRVNQDFGYGDNTEWGNSLLNWQEHLWISTPDNNDPGRYYGAVVWGDWYNRDSRTTPLVNGDVIECICSDFYPNDNPKVIFE